MRGATNDNQNRRIEGLTPPRGGPVFTLLKLGLPELGCAGEFSSRLELKTLCQKTSAGFAPDLFHVFNRVGDVEWERDSRCLLDRSG